MMIIHTILFIYKCALFVYLFFTLYYMFFSLFICMYKNVSYTQFSFPIGFVVIMKCNVLFGSRTRPKSSVYAANVISLHSSIHTILTPCTDLIFSTLSNPLNIILLPLGNVSPSDLLLLLLHHLYCLCIVLLWKIKFLNQLGFL